MKSNLRKIMVESLLLILVISIPSYGSQERIWGPHEVTIVANAGDFGEVSVEMKSIKEDDKFKISSIRMKINNEWINVPAKAFSDLEDPLLNDLEIRSEPGWGEFPWLYIYFKVAHMDETGKFSPKGVHIGYHNGKFERRSVSTPVNDTKTRHYSIDL